MSRIDRRRVAALAYDGLGAFELGIVAEVFGLPRPEMGKHWYRFRVCSLEAGRDRRQQAHLIGPGERRIGGNVLSGRSRRLDVAIQLGECGFERRHGLAQVVVIFLRRFLLKLLDHDGGREAHAVEIEACLDLLQAIVDPRPLGVGIRRAAKAQILGFQCGDAVGPRVHRSFLSELGRRGRQGLESTPEALLRRFGRGLRVQLFGDRLDERHVEVR